MPLVISGNVVKGWRPNALSDGNVALPAISFNNSTTTGIYHAGNGVLAFTSNGSQVATMTTTTLTITKDVAIGGGGALYVGNGVTLNNPAANVFAVRTGGAERMRIDANGNVGIPSGAGLGDPPGFPTGKFHISSDYTPGASNFGNMYFSNPAGGYGGLVINHGINSYGSGAVITASTNPLTVNVAGGTGLVVTKELGRVGIGTAAPSYPLHVVGTASGSIGNHGYLNGTAPTGLWNSGSVSIDASAYFSSAVSALLYRAFSDRRIKKDISPLSNGLGKLRRLKPVEYQYIDHITKGTAPAVGFIAQDVAEHLPGAVATNRDSVPDVFMLCSVNLQESVIECENARAGELVVHTVRGEKTLQVTAVHNGMRFTPSDLAAEDLKDGHVFVFGFKVDDFHVLDKNALFTINVAATQELDRIVRKLEARIVELEALVKP